MERHKVSDPPHELCLPRCLRVPFIIQLLFWAYPGLHSFPNLVNLWCHLIMQVRGHILFPSSSPSPAFSPACLPLSLASAGRHHVL
jgi:hypothetical protein